MRDGPSALAALQADGIAGGDLEYDVVIAELQAGAPPLLVLLPPTRGLTGNVLLTTRQQALIDELVSIALGSSMAAKTPSLHDPMHEAIVTGDANVVVGTVAFWHGEDGWGAIRAAGRPGLGFVHFSPTSAAWRDTESVTEGELVEFEWANDRQQDGCQWQVAWVRPVARN